MITNPKSGHTHKSEEAMQSCIGCSDPGALEFGEPDLAYARDLIAAGYHSTSNKYRRVSRFRLPPFETLFTILPEAEQWIVDEMRKRYESIEAHELRGPRAEYVELTLAQFRAFKHLGGPSA